jgi:hypothetical protein
MTTPPKQEKIWKNIDWKDEDEKRAFFNKYFKDSRFVRELLDPLKKQIDELHSKLKELEKKK